MPDVSPAGHGWVPDERSRAPEARHHKDLRLRGASSVLENAELLPAPSAIPYWDVLRSRRLAAVTEN
jgi:hypothetical protein